jgi:hypothetical protein
MQHLWRQLFEVLFCRKIKDDLPILMFSSYHILKPSHKTFIIKMALEQHGVIYLHTSHCIKLLFLSRKKMIYSKASVIYKLLLFIFFNDKSRKLKKSVSFHWSDYIGNIANTHKPKHYVIHVITENFKLMKEK